jgi:hypothetical protein
MLPSHCLIISLPDSSSSHPSAAVLIPHSLILGIREDAYKYGVGTIKLYHGIALLLLVMFLVQLVTGFILISLISLQLDLAFTHLYFILTSNWYI